VLLRSSDPAHRAGNCEAAVPEFLINAVGPFLGLGLGGGGGGGGGANAGRNRDWGAPRQPRADAVPGGWEANTPGGGGGGGGGQEAAAAAARGDDLRRSMAARSADMAPAPAPAPAAPTIDAEELRRRRLARFQ
jgi:hypothetical protein